MRNIPQEYYAALKNVPEELKILRQWCLADAEQKAPLFVYKDNVRLASVSNSANWTTFDDAVNNAQLYNCVVGMVFTNSDPYTVIDLDIRDSENYPTKPSAWTSAEDIERHYKIIDFMDSYTEYSLSGKGFHVVLKGRAAKNCRRGHVEVYSTVRFMIFTGNVFRDVPIVSNQLKLDTLVREITNGEQEERVDATLSIYEDADELLTDEELVMRIAQTANAEKFKALWNGVYDNTEYPSQSEADYALLSYLCFYTKSNVQVRRVFRFSKLGARTKATQNDVYLNRSINKIRLETERLEQLKPSPELIKTLCNNIEAEPTLTKKNIPDLNWPPGLVGEVAKWIYNSSVRPVAEISIAAALAFFAGVCGKAYNYQGTGLNLYIIVIAKSAVGKEAIHTGISSIVNNIQATAPSVVDFVEFSEFASPQALTKELRERTSFVNVMGEIGRKLQTMSLDKPDNMLSQLRSMWTNLYQKSGVDSTFGGLKYSDKTKNTEAVGSVAFSLIGETTPTTFYDSVTESMLADGFLSRMLTVAYSGDRPHLNYDRNTIMPAEMALRLADLVNQAKSINDSFTVCEVECTPAAEKKLREFDILCSNEINSTEVEAWRQLWNRAHLKVLKLSALFAVADNSLFPLIKEEHLIYALELVQRDIRLFRERLKNGDIGLTDDTRLRKLVNLIMAYLHGHDTGLHYKKALAEVWIVPRIYLQSRVATQSSFNRHRNGAAFALDVTLRIAMENGLLTELSLQQLQSLGIRGKAYQILEGILEIN